MFWIQLFIFSGGLFWMLFVALFLLWFVEDNSPIIDDEAYMADDDDPEFWNN